MSKNKAGILLGFTLAMGVGFTFSSPGDDGFTTGESVTATIMNEIRTFFLRFDSSIVFVEEPVTASTIEAAITAACSARSGTNQIYNCKEVIIPSGSHSITETVYLTGDGAAPSSDTAEGILGLKMRGSGSTYHTGSRSVAADENSCGTTLVWDGSSSAPFFQLHGVRRAKISDLCLIMDGGADGTNPATDGFLVTATNADSEVSQGIVFDNVDIEGYSGSWATNNTYTSRGFRLVASDLSDATDAQIDNFVVQNSRIRADICFDGRNGNTNGVFFVNNVCEYGIVGYDVEDTDLHVYGGYDVTSAAYSGTGDEATACAATVATFRIGSTTDQQPKNVSIVSHNTEGDCGKYMTTVDASSSVNQRRSSTSVIASSIAFGSASVENVVHYTHHGNFDWVGTVIGLRNGETYVDTGEEFFNFAPVSGSSLYVNLTGGYITDWDSGNFKVTTNAQTIKGTGADNMNLADSYTWTGTQNFTGATTTVATASAGDNDTSAASTAFVTTAVNAKSAATSTDNAVPKFDSTAGDVQNSGVLIDDSNNVTIPGSITSGTSGSSCLILRDSDDAGDSACAVLNGTFSCETDTNGVCGDAT